jgi:hypothetical protein
LAATWSNMADTCSGRLVRSALVTPTVYEDPPGSRSRTGKA